MRDGKCSRRALREGEIDKRTEVHKVACVRACLRVRVRCALRCLHLANVITALAHTHTPYLVSLEMHTARREACANSNAHLITLIHMAAKILLP